jgi:aryl-alcohol dehydrogenase-like predicted oxidoreductase
MEVLSAYVAAGGNFIDTANVYSRWATNNPGGTAETVIGRWLKATSQRRDQLVIATKVRGAMGDGPNDAGASRAHLMSAVEASLKRLQTDYIDLYQLHWPDMETPLEETLRALDDLVSSGKVRYLGASNFPAWYLMKSLWVSDKHDYVRFEALQPHYNLMHRDEFERELMAVCKDQHLAVIPYSPLAGGFLTGKYRKGQPMPSGSRGENNEQIKRYAESAHGQNTLGLLEEIGNAHGKTILQTAIAWLLTNPVVTAPIIGANNILQLRESLGAASFRLNDDEMEALNQLDIVHRQ